MLVHNEEDFKYVMQDLEKYYFGARYSYEEMMDRPEVPLKFKTIIERYLAHDLDRSTTIESHLYFMTDENLDYRTLRSLRARIRCSELTCPRTKGRDDTYCEKLYKPDQLAKISASDKMEKGIIIRELSISKLGLMMFQV